MDREISAILNSWLLSSDRKPLVLRGARQVGKTWLVRDLSRRSDLQLIEVNFERDPDAQRCFRSNDPAVVLGELSLLLNKSIVPEKTILFLDEIQAAGEVLAKLRWFAEEMPQLPVVAAGSLLEFTLTDLRFSMPVGRVGYLHVEPMGFMEFLTAHQQEYLAQGIREWRPERELPPILHEKAMKWFDTYLTVGGMPAIVQLHSNGGMPAVCRELQADLLATYRADFAKYSHTMDSHVLDAALRAVAAMLGKKFIYARIDDNVKQHQARRAIELLCAARLCHVVGFSSANGLPLGGELRDSFRKLILADVGLLHALLRLPAVDSFPEWDTLAPSVRGQVSEQIVGQLIRLFGPLHDDGPELYYWQRDGGRPGEIDYLIQSDTSIVPVELKSGASGAMKSLHQFMFDKKLQMAVRIDRNPPALFTVSVKTTQGDAVQYRLLSIPYYCIEMLPAILPAIL